MPIALAMLATAGCSAGEGPDERVGQASEEPRPSASAEGSTAGDFTPSTTVAIDGDTPFSPYFAVIGGLAAAGTRTGEARETRWDQVEEFVAACMTDAGFEYLPLEYLGGAPGLPDYLAGGDSLRLPRLPEARADAERVGYGTDDVEAGEAALTAGAEPGPNAVYYEALTEAGRAAYDLALTGSAGPTEQTAEGGCVGRAWEEYPDPSASESQALFYEQYSSLLAAMVTLPMPDVTLDARTAELNEEWDACMVESGHPMPWPAYGKSDPDPLAAWDLAVRTPPGGVAGEPQPDVPTLEIPIEERYLLGSAEERAIAVADYDCRASTDYERRLLEIQVDLEAQFVAAHREELDEMAAAVELAGS